MADFGVRGGSSYTWLLWLLQAVWIFFKTNRDNIAKDYQKIPWSRRTRSRTRGVEICAAFLSRCCIWDRPQDFCN
ncbi:hypothetical protein CY35_10G031700 [Sphagnum magellanicum]|nr:hypothetical protein CY35_10G031700 [Sphagnum magellanicum]